MDRDNFGRDRSFDDDWRFFRGDAPRAENFAFDDTGWRTIDVPHDWSIEDLPGRNSPFDKGASAGGFYTGWAVGGTGWYRKRFRLPVNADRHVQVRFDGVYMNSDVWLNGAHLATHPGGYTPFTCELTPHLVRDGGDNVLAVRVRNDGSNSRWYSGSGIYRHVWLTVTGPLRVPGGGVFVRTPEVSPEAASIDVGVEVIDERPVRRDAAVEVRITNPDGAAVATGRATCDGPTVHVACRLARPRLWSPHSPALYRAEVSVVADGAIADRVETTFGIRSIEVDARRGLLINGQSVRLKGGCVHHDNGILGAVAIDRAEERRVELLKAAGFNAVRTAHNPPSPAFLDACDRLGVLVMNELFDEWERTKVPQGSGRFFGEWHDREVEAVVRRDRNHPSVILWSIGNEIHECYDRPDIAAALRAAVCRHDPTRPVTSGVCAPWWKSDTWVDWPTSSDPAFAHLDVAGYNYLFDKYEPDHARVPDRVIVGTESHAKHAFENWRLVERHPWVLGDFVWTAIDYIGESSIGQTFVDTDGVVGFTFPFHTAVCGDLDLLGRRKPQSYYREALWREGIVHVTVHQPLGPGQRENAEGWSPKWGWPIVRSHWTYPGHEGKPLRVAVYSSCERVRLLLNGRDLGEKPATREQRNVAEFGVPYEPGELRAVGTLADGRIVEHVLRTAEAPVALGLTADRSVIRASRGDLAFVDVIVVDALGVEVPSAAVPVRIDVTGPAELAALGNANPVDVDGLRDPIHRTWRGRAQAIVRPRGEPGTITVRATADGLAAGECAILVPSPGTPGEG